MLTIEQTNAAALRAADDAERLRMRLGQLLTFGQLSREQRIAFTKALNAADLCRDRIAGDIRPVKLMSEVL